MSIDRDEQRAIVLQNHGLPADKTFEIRPEKHPAANLWWVAVSWPGAPVVLWDVGGATKLATAIKSFDRALADQLERVVQEAKRLAGYA